MGSGISQRGYIMSIEGSGSGRREGNSGPRFMVEL